LRQFASRVVTFSLPEVRCSYNNILCVS
jgi:hypothetical protein